MVGRVEGMRVMKGTDSDWLHFYFEFLLKQRIF
jgi:hypothetical protein